MDLLLPVVPPPTRSDVPRPDVPALLAAPHGREDVAAYEAALGDLAGDETDARTDALVALAAVLPVGDATRQIALAEEAHVLAGRLGDDRGQAWAAGLEGRALFFLSESRAAAVRLAEAIARFDRLGMADERLAFRSILAAAHANLGDYEAALAGALGNLGDVRASGERVAEAWILVGLSAAYTDMGDAARALDAAEHAREIFDEVAFPVGVARAETGIGAALLLQGNADAAEVHLTDALARFHALGDAVGESRALDDLGTAARLRGDVEAGLALHREALARRRTLANRHAESTSLLHVGDALLALGRPAEAAEALHEALETAERMGARPREAQVHALLVDTYGALGDPARALTHAKAHLAVREGMLDAQTRARIQAVELRFETERLRESRDAEAARSAALREANRRLTDTLDELRAAQSRLVQTEKLASLGRVTAGIAHEIKNPLNFVVGFSSLAAELVDDLTALVARHPPQDAHAVGEATETLGVLAANVARVREHALRADGIVSSMLNHVRTVGGPRGLVAVSDLVGTALEEATLTAPSGLRVVRDDGLDAAEVEVEAGSIRRVFVNLFANALTALADRAESAPDGWEPTLTVTTRRLAESAVGPAVEVRVADNGPGLAPGARGRVFEPFFTTRPTGEGTGLGLSLAYDIVTEGHGGRLEYADAPGDGATFVVTLPVG